MSRLDDKSAELRLHGTKHFKTKEGPNAADVALGLVFTAIRLKTGLNPVEFAEEHSFKNTHDHEGYAVSGSTITAWERGQYHDVSFFNRDEKKQKYAEISGTSVDAIETATHNVAALLKRMATVPYNSAKLPEYAESITEEMRKDGFPIEENIVARKIAVALEPSAGKRK